MPRLLLLAALFLVTRVHAQVVETPQYFDSNGRFMALTPSLVTRAGLGPPEWTITGDYIEARLFQLSSGAHVISVTRRDQVVERYEVSLADLNAIRTKVNTIPPQFSFRSDGEARSDFVRHQTLMGLFVYGPSLAIALTSETTGGVSAYLLTAGATFFAATQLAREIQITPEMHSLSAHMSVRGGFMGAALTYAAGAHGDIPAGGVFVGGLGGTALGLVVGRHWTAQEVVASQVGADFFGLTTLGVAQIVRADREESLFLTRGEAAVVTGMELSGYLLGRAYGQLVDHAITPGDASTLWVTAALGAAAGSITYAGRDVGRRTTATALTVGGIVGVAAGELLLSSRFDLSQNEASLMGLGTGAGALIGVGAARLIDNEGRTNARTMTFATVGGIGGLFLTHFLLAPALDAGRNGGGSAEQRSALQFNPAAIALTAAGVPGTFPVLRLTFD